MINPSMGADLFPERQPKYFAYNFQVSDDAMRIEAHKTILYFCTSKKMPHVRAVVTKMPFVGSNRQVYSCNLHKRPSADFPNRALLFKKALPWSQRNH